MSRAAKLQGESELADDSREKILLAARQIFAEKGVTGASVRAITSAAGVNHALIGYYFGSKLALYEEVVERATEIITRPKFERLAELRQEYGDAPIPIKELLDAYIRSFYDGYGDPQSITKVFVRFYGFLLSEQDDEVHKATIDSGDSIRSAYLREFELTFPELTRKEIVYRFGAMLGVITFWRNESGFMDAHFEEEDQGQLEVEEIIEEVISMCCGIFTSAPSRINLAAGKRKNRQATVQKSITSSSKSTPTKRTSRRHRKRTVTER